MTELLELPIFLHNFKTYNHKIDGNILYFTLPVQLTFIQPNVSTISLVEKDTNKEITLFHNDFYVNSKPIKDREPNEQLFQEFLKSCFTHTSWKNKYTLSVKGHVEWVLHDLLHLIFDVNHMSYRKHILSFSFSDSNRILVEIEIARIVEACYLLMYLQEYLYGHYAYSIETSLTKAVDNIVIQIINLSKQIEYNIDDIFKGNLGLHFFHSSFYYQLKHKLSKALCP